MPHIVFRFQISLLIEGRLIVFFLDRNTMRHTVCCVPGPSYWLSSVLTVIPVLLLQTIYKEALGVAPAPPTPVFIDLLGQNVADFFLHKVLNT